MSERKIGVYTCGGCGIADALDMDQLEAAAKEQKAGFCKSHDCLCSDEGVALIAADVAAGEVTHPIVAACSPRVMEDKFRFDGVETIRANLREMVVWSHPANDEDTQMLGDDQVRMAIAQAKKSMPPEPWTEGAFSETVMVVGGG